MMQHLERKTVNSDASLYSVAYVIG